MSPTEKAARKVRTARALLGRMTTPIGKSAGHDAVLGAMVEFWVEASRLPGADVERSSETRLKIA